MATDMDIIRTKDAITLLKIGVSLTRSLYVIDELNFQIIDLETHTNEQAGAGEWVVRRVDDLINHVHEGIRLWKILTVVRNLLAANYPPETTNKLGV